MEHQASSEPQHVSYRSGAAARLAGLSPETLRVWERRYNLSNTERSERGQRLYSAEQVRKLSLLKQLVDQGHAIGVLALMPDAQLQELANAAYTQPDAVGPIRIGVIGSNLAKRIAGSARDRADLVLEYSRSQLEQAAQDAPNASVEVLVIEQSELHDNAVSLIAGIKNRWGAVAVVVLYRFCASATIRALRAQDCLVARVPADVNELALLCRSALTGERLPPQPPSHLPDIRFDESALLTIMASGSGLACECPKHLADLLMMVGSFERYSAQCASRSADDAQLHSDLQRAAGQARAILEAAMEKLATAEGLPMPPTTRL
ncbi:MerR family transcriptional regulator [Achromobacter sp. AONIH1]|jgi:DNA-binding transcriptional MerR regulator|uniref:MerR family transcriptional regulator n=1 Tax=Achromobacter sp. AONIH1 TaxID=1758194 RepID=UPI000CD20CE8|nr:MerR family transcriptional regulator [Achromobacter sp. AONIH1]AUT46639.1 helix-turn-helix-type transcriptional regulator [Achromobacter sp. AONIH1]